MSIQDGLTDRQQEVLDFIVDRVTNRGYGPTVREIGEQFDIRSPNGVICHLKALEKKGLIIRAKGSARGIELCPELMDEIMGHPFRGVVHAGMTNLAFELNEWVRLGDMFPRDNTFVLKVSGDSMIEAQIADGDYVVIRRQSHASKGEIVVAQNEDGEATLKYWFPEENRVRLQPANSHMEPIYLKNPTVMGVLTGVVRSIA